MEAARHLHHALGELCVFRNRFGGAINHHRGEAQAQRLHADVKTVAVIQMDGNGHVYLACAPFADLHKPVVAAVCAGRHIVSQNNRRTHGLGCLADGHDDIVIAALRVDGRNGVAAMARTLELFKIGT